MTTAELAVQDGALAVRDQHFWNREQLAALSQLGIREATNADLAIFLHYCQKTGLDPFSRQIYMIHRREKQGDEWVSKQVIQVGIDGFRVIARRAAKRERETLEYEDSAWCGVTGEWVDVWLGGSDQPPAAARVAILRDGKRFPGVVRYSAFVPMKNGRPTGLWARMDAEQLEKCAEAKALRRAYPHDLGGVYLPEEMPAPVHDDGMLDVSQMDEIERDARGVMTRHQRVEHEQLRRMGEPPAGGVEKRADPDPDDRWTAPPAETASNEVPKREDPSPQPAGKAAIEKLDRLVASMELGTDADVRALFEWLTAAPWTATRSQVQTATSYLDDHLKAAQGDVLNAANAAWAQYSQANPQAADDGA